MIGDFVYLAFNNLKKRKLRAALTMLGIFISIATIFILISVSLGLEASVQEQFRILGTDKFIIMPKGQVAGPGTTSAVELTMDDINVIKRTQGVKDYSYFTAGNVEVNFKSKTRFVMAIGFPLDNFAVLSEAGFYKAEEGRFLQKGETGKIMVGNLYSKGSVFPSPVNLGNTLTINGVDFKVGAVLEPIGSPTDDKLIYMSIDDLKPLINNSEKIDEIIVQVNPGENITQIASKVEKNLLTFRGKTQDTEDFTISTPQELLASFGSILNILTAFLVGIAAISLLVGGVGIANTMYTSVLERTSEIGVMKAVGARNSDILFIFLIESGLLGLIGGIIGVILGFLGSKFIEAIANNALGKSILLISPPIYLYVGCLAFASFMGALFGVWPAWRASKIRPVEALRYQ